MNRRWLEFILSQRPRRQPAYAYRRRRTAGILLLLLLGGLTWYLWYITGDERVRYQMEAELEKISGGQVEVEAASLDVLREIRIQRMQIYLPDRPKTQENLVFSAEDVQVIPEFWSILTARPRLNQVIAYRAELHVWYDQQRKLTNFQLLKPSGMQTQGMAIPEIILRENRFSYQELDPSHDAPAIHQTISGRIFPDPTDPRRCGFDFSASEEGMLKQSSFRGVYDLANRRLLETEGNFLLELLDISRLPSRVAEWQKVYEMSQPQGEVFTRSRYDPEQGQTVQIGIEKGSLVLPVPQIRIPLQEVDAKIVCTEERINIESLSGRYKNYCQFEAKGTIHGYHPEAAFSVNLEVRDLNIPRELWQSDETREKTSRSDPNSIRDIQSLFELLPEPWKSDICQFYPTGRMDLSVSLRRGESPGGDLIASGRMTCRGANFEYKNFRYLFENLWGDVVFEKNAVVIGQLRPEGEATGNVIEGRWQKHPEGSELDFTVQWGGVALDNRLYSAFRDWQKELWDQFRPSGTADVRYQLSWRPGQPDRTDIQIQLKDVNLSYAVFPLPLEHGQGSIVWSEGEAKFDLNPIYAAGGRICMKGQARDLSQKPFYMKAEMEYENLQVVSSEYAYWPDSIRSFFEDLQFEGVLSGRANIESGQGKAVSRGDSPLLSSVSNATGSTASGQGAVNLLSSYQAEVLWRDGRMRPRGFPCQFTNLEGRADVGADGVRIHQCLGQRGKTRLDVRGTMKNLQQYSLHVEGKPLEMDEELWGAISGDTMPLIASSAVRGLANLSLDLFRSPSCDGSEYHGTIEFLEAELRVPYWGYPLQKVQGRVQFGPDALEIASLQSRDDHMEMNIRGKILLEPEGWDSRFEVDIPVLNLDPAFSELLPKRLESLCRSLQLEGQFRGHVLAQGRQGENQRQVWDLQGTIHGEELRMQSPVVFQGMQGDVNAQAHYDSGDDVFNVTGMVRNVQCLARGKTIRDASSQINYDSRDRKLTFSEISGGFCGGQMGGTIQTDLQMPLPGYRTELLFQDVDLKELLADETKKQPWRQNLRGWLDGRIDVARGQADQPRRGVFSVKVRDAVLGELPLAGQLLHVFNLSLPEEGAFHSAILEGELIDEVTQFQQIQLRGSAVTLNGAGVMKEPDHHLQLVFVMESPHDLPKIPIVSSFFQAVNPGLMQVRVEGPFEEPVVEPVALPGLDEAWKEFSPPEKKSSQTK